MRSAAQSATVSFKVLDDRRSLRFACRLLLSFSAWIILSSLFLVGAASAASFNSCLSRLQRQAIKAGISSSVVEEMLSGAKYDEKVIRFSTSQPEYKTPIWDYMAFLVDPERIADGRAFLKKHQKVLRAIERKYDVDRHVVLAVWGIESDYGKFRGDFYTPHALVNLVCAGGRRARYFRSELMATLKIAHRGDVSPDAFQGSWAGAFGQTQFMPTTYMRLAVDHDRDGRRDLIHSVDDALASTANFLKDAGWRSNRPWGIEVVVPKGYNGPIGRTKRSSLTTWNQRGLRRIDGARLSGRLETGLIRPAGEAGPSFLVTRNFDALRSYNASQSYGLAIALLSELVSGGNAFKAPWPTNDPGLSRKQRLHLQQLLNANGFDVGEPDGKIGPMTRAGIKRAQSSFGMVPTGRPSFSIYSRLGGSFE
ncbi:MAG: lytic murein transglycosylase [Rhodobacteraceae bacterium]|nr:lytic murein transglycosylase [Paracoccaceae bacterium]